MGADKSDKPYRHYGPDEEEDELDADELVYFKQRLLDERGAAVARLERSMSTALADDETLPDELDQATRLTEQQMLFKTADKARKLLAEIDHALSKFDGGDYGICEGTDDPIKRRRLDSRPWTRYSVEYKEKLERHKKTERGG